MISWDRCGDSVIVLFSPRQIRWLRKHLTDYRNRVDRGFSEFSGDPVLGQVFAGHSAEDLNSRIDRARQSITVALDNLPTHGGVLEIRGDSDRMTWIWTLQELRGAVTARLAANPTGSTVVAETSAKLQLWLSSIAEALLSAGDLPLFSSGPNHDFQSRK